MKKTANMSPDRIRGLIRDFIATSPLNTMQNEAGDPAWDDALVGFASGADPIWQQYKEYIGPFHWTPWEVFSQHCPRGNSRTGGADRHFVDFAAAGDGPQGEPPVKDVSR